MEINDLGLLKERGAVTFPPILSVEVAQFPAQAEAQGCAADADGRRGNTPKPPGVPASARRTNQAADETGHATASYQISVSRGYVGLALMAVLEVIDWPAAIAIAIGHELAHRARTRALRELGGGIEAAG